MTGPQLSQLLKCSGILPETENDTTMTSPPWMPAANALPAPRDAEGELSLDALRRFLLDPAGQFLRQRLDIRLAEIEDAGEDIEPLQAPGHGLQRNRLQRAAFDALLADFKAHIGGRDLFVQDLIGGADRSHSIRARVVTELAWHSLFIRNLLIRPTAEELAGYVPQMTIVDLPTFKADPKRHGTLSETVELRKGDTPWVRNRETARLFAERRFDGPPTRR